MKKTMALALAGALAALTAACSNATNTGNGTATNTAAANSAAANTSGNATAPAAPPKGEDIPAGVRAAFPDAQSITKQHKDLTPAQIASIEKETGTKVDDTDHHSYLAFSTSGGARKQVGAATVVEAGGKQLVVVYESREGLPYIKEVRGDGVAQGFLDQFKGKGHDDKFRVGQDLKAQGVDDATAKSVADAIRRDIMTMETLYGSEHSH
ncbi:MAG TPA: hypothetical protein VNZ44_00840 [Pyrinomonadaceae bacterium]|nr:hypothetical protein [Pyrinomonadaceae bacterium]